jgi:uncharacterized protein
VSIQKWTGTNSALDNLVEIKAGMTIIRNYFKVLNHFAKIFSDLMPKGSGFVYGGSEAQQRTNVAIVTCQCLDDLFQW